MDYEVTKHGTYEFWLNDRLEKIREVNEKYDLENNAIICFSGGIDSVVMHHLIDMALPNNKIPRVYSNTAIEYKLMVKFVEKLAKEDDRIKIVMPKTNIKELL